MVAWVIGTSAVLIHKVGDDDAAPAVLFGVTVIVPGGIDCSATACEWYGVSKYSRAVGVPLIVITLASQAAVTPAGKTYGCSYSRGTGGGMGDSNKCRIDT